MMLDPMMLESMSSKWIKDSDPMMLDPMLDRAQ